MWGGARSVRQVRDFVTDRRVGHHDLRETGTVSDDDKSHGREPIARGLTVDEMVERSSVSREVYTAIENLAHSVDIRELSALAPVLGLTAAEVLDSVQAAGLE